MRADVDGTAGGSVPAALVVLVSVLLPAPLRNWPDVDWVVEVEVDAVGWSDDDSAADDDDAAAAVEDADEMRDLRQLRRWLLDAEDRRAEVCVSMAPPPPPPPEPVCVDGDDAVAAPDVEDAEVDAELAAAAAVGVTVLSCS